MTKGSKARVARIFGVSVLTLLLCLGVGVLYAGWPPFVGTSGFSMSGIGYGAMAIGLLAVILLGLGVALLIHHDRR